MSLIVAPLAGVPVGPAVSLFPGYLTVPVPPPIGTIENGQLLIDAQTRTAWLGVIPEVDPAQAILIADIAACFERDEIVRIWNKDYTDSQILTRAPISHTHVAADITDLDEYITDVLHVSGTDFQVGMIMMWSGNMSDIGVDQTASGGANLKNWWLCDGTHGTPDLRDRFILAAGHKANKQVNQPELVTVKTGPGGTHSHTAYTQPYTLAGADMPLHTHNVNDPGHIHPLSDPKHHHGFSPPSRIEWANAATNLPYPGYWNTTGVTGSGITTSDDSTGISISSNTTGITIVAAGGDSAGSVSPHKHGITVELDHTHTVPELTPNLPWVALAYIMKFE